MECQPPFNTPSGQNQCNNSMDSPLKLEGIVHQIKFFFNFKILTHLPAFVHVHIMDSFFCGGGRLLSPKSVNNIGVGFLYFPFPAHLTYSLCLLPPQTLPPFHRAESGTCMPKSSTPLRTCSWTGKIHVSCCSPGVAYGSRVTPSSEFDR